jgi:hypothetical protein
MSGKRNPNFSESELQTLLTEVEKHKALLFSKLSSVVTNSAKKRAWDTICSRINAVNTNDTVVYSKFMDKTKIRGGKPVY